MVIPLRPWMNVEYTACETRLSSRELDNQRTVIYNTRVFGQTRNGGRDGSRWANWKTLTLCKEDAAYTAVRFCPPQKRVLYFPRTDCLTSPC